MFALVESSRSLSLAGGWAGRAGSFAVHSLLIATAVLATRHAASAPPPDVIHIVDIVWPGSPAPTRVSPPGNPGLRLPAPRYFPLPTMPTIPAPNVPSVFAPAPAPGVPVDSAAGRTPGLPGAPRGTGTAPVDVRGVDELPLLLAHPPLRYPELLRQAGVEGGVLVEVVLDTLGRVEPASLRIARSDNALFDDAARAVVAGSTYRPARMAGRAVRVRVQVPVWFTIRR